MSTILSYLTNSLDIWKSSCCFSWYLTPNRSSYQLCLLVNPSYHLCLLVNPSCQLCLLVNPSYQLCLLVNSYFTFCFKTLFWLLDLNHYFDFLIQNSVLTLIKNAMKKIILNFWFKTLFWLSDVKFDSPFIAMGRLILIERRILYLEIWKKSSMLEGQH